MSVEPKQADAFYLTPEWRKLMASIKDQRGHRCEDCGKSGIRLFGDHIVELRDGGAQLDPRNVKLLCGSCHSRKTAAMRAQRLSRRDP